jgi:hypothetical protein
MLTLIGSIQLALAENATQVDGYTIHHNALTTDNLTPGVAQAYNIQRSKNRGMLTISVLKNQANATGIPVKAVIKAQATNLNNQLRDITLHEVNEGGAIYYIADFRVSNEETLTFELEVTPEGADKTYTAKLTQEFFTAIE